LPPRIAESWRPTPPYLAHTIVGITILAPLLGGATQLWAQAVIAFAVGILLISFPPRKSLGPLPNFILCALLCISLTGFLPANWFPLPRWRIDLVQLGAQLPTTRSPQPWLSFQWVGFLLLGLAWTYYLLAFRWNEHRRKQACRLFGIGILVLAIMLIIAFVTKSRVPFWPNAPEFGFFPNRNQTSNVLGLGGVMIYALSLQSFVEGRKYWSVWLIVLAIICWALIINRSRSGIILFFVGAMALHFYFWKGMQARRRPLIAFGGIALLIALFIINGGTTLARFGLETAQLPENLRWSFYRDALGLIVNSSLLGNGLGNFRPLFAFSRSDSMIANEAAHPESDWLWSAVDLGWPAVIGILVLFGWWITKCRPFEPGTGRLLRVAALICGCGFAVHGIFDVSGHRPGALWPALFFASIAIHPKAEFVRTSAISIILRLVGVLLIAIGIWWMRSSIGFKSLPTTDEVERIKASVTAAIDRQDFASVPDLAAAGLRIAPLDWLLYYKRAIAEVATAKFREIALRDFAMARYLNRLWPDLCLHEGQVWLGAGDTDLAMDSWNECLRRAGDQAPNFYSDMLASANGNAAILDDLRQRAENNNALLVKFLRATGPFEFQMESTRLFADERQLGSFSPKQLSDFFSEWYKKGDRLELAEILRRHPQWQKFAWREMAHSLADYQDYKQAWDIVQQFQPPPQIPRFDSNQSVEKLGATFLFDRMNLQNGLRLYFAQMKHGQREAAFGTLSQLIALPGAPKYLSYLEARFWADDQDWAKAWKAWERFDSR
jgi:hypothetical protein